MSLVNIHSFRNLIIINAILIPVILMAQYAPPAGQPGTSAISKDSSAFIGWASTCSIERGYVNMSDTTIKYNDSNKATYGSYLYASGPADELVVSLGDRGSALLGFDNPIVNRTGHDFAVFENSFGDSFLELGFVEVSSDGLHFVRFPSISLTPENQQVNTFDTIDARKIHNLAGKYRHTFGTPFDLIDIKDSAGIDISHITHVRILDAGGCVQLPFSTYDSQGHKVNDPWPTPFDTGGFDLDAVGVINNQSNGMGDDSELSVIRIYPNPAVDFVTVEVKQLVMVGMKILDPAGHMVFEGGILNRARIDLSSLAAGIYIASFNLRDGSSINQKIIKY